MKRSLLLLMLLFLICIFLPIVVSFSEGMTTTKDADGNTKYGYNNDLDSLKKSKTMDPNEDIATVDTNLSDDFFDSVHIGPYYKDDGEDESKYISHSKYWKGTKDSNENFVKENSNNVVDAENAGYYNSGSPKKKMSDSETTLTQPSNANTTRHPSADTTAVQTTTSNKTLEERVDNSIGIISYFRNLFKKNTESFDNVQGATAAVTATASGTASATASGSAPAANSSMTRRVTDSSNKPYDIAQDYELYNEKGDLKLGPHDNTDYGTLLDILDKEYKDLEKKYKVKNGPLKCIADFATDIGEDLCCGQTGVLQDTKYVCPSEKPTCSNFKCGSKFGTCN